MDNESKKPCAPVEEEGRDYNELGLYLHGKTMQTAMELWEMLPGWMEARRMAFVDPEYIRTHCSAGGTCAESSERDGRMESGRTHTGWDG